MINESSRLMFNRNKRMCACTIALLLLGFRFSHHFAYDFHFFFKTNKRFLFLLWIDFGIIFFPFVYFLCFSFILRNKQSRKKHHFIIISSLLRNRRSFLLAYWFTSVCRTTGSFTCSVHFFICYGLSLTFRWS